MTTFSDSDSGTSRAAAGGDDGVVEGDLFGAAVIEVDRRLLESVNFP